MKISGRIINFFHHYFSRINLEGLHSHICGDGAGGHRLAVIGGNFKGEIQDFVVFITV